MHHGLQKLTIALFRRYLETLIGGISLRFLVRAGDAAIDVILDQYIKCTLYRQNKSDKMILTSLRQS